jgi:hypothetical protein
MLVVVVVVVVVAAAAVDRSRMLTLTRSLLRPSAGWSKKTT